MICKGCHVGYMLTHPQREFEERGWLKCSLCGWCHNKKEPKSEEEVLIKLYEENEELMDALDDKNFNDYEK